MPDPTLANSVALILTAALAAYVLFAGADFGGGVWDLLASGPRKARQREVIAHSIAPIWEANHVWLILAVVLLFTCFPAAFARLSIVLHIPLSLMLVGIVLRGSAFVFRSYDTAEDRAQRRWGRLFAIASLLTPLLLGISIGALVSGKVVELDHGDFVVRFVDPWFTPFSLAVGLLTLAVFALLAAVFLTMETTDPELVEDFRRRALLAGVSVFATAFVALALAPGGAPLLHQGLLASTWAMPFHVLTGLAAMAVLAALWLEDLPSGRLAGGSASSLYHRRVGALAISVCDSAGPHHRVGGGTAGNAAPDHHRSAGRRRRPASVADLSLSSLQERPGRSAGAACARRVA